MPTLKKALRCCCCLNRRGLATPSAGNSYSWRILWTTPSGVTARSSGRRLENSTSDCRTSEQRRFHMAVECASPSCHKEASKMACPICLRDYGRSVHFCDQQCFKDNFVVHKKEARHKLDPFAKSKVNGSDFQYTGPLKAVYPLSARRLVPDHIPKPDHALDKDGRSRVEEKMRSKGPRILNESERESMRTVCRMGREILDIAAAALAPGVTTDEIDAIVHEETIKRNAYPSPLNYYQFPKSLCTSVNEVICHGIPDLRKLEDGDIINLDISLYYDGFHGDLNETYYVGEKAKSDKDSVRVVETARECLALAIETVKPGTPLRSFGRVISDHAKKNKCSVVRTYCGHGINQLFHCSPNIPHYADNKQPGICTEGMVFTIEPMINLGSSKDVTWPDNWTAVTVDGRRSAQFEHTLLITKDGCEVLTARKADSPGGPVPRPKGPAVAE